MKKYIAAAIIAVAVVSVGSSVLPVKAESEQAAHWKEMQAEMIKRYDTHITDVQKRYNCVIAANSDETLAACNKTNYPETGCP